MKFLVLFIIFFHFTFFFSQVTEKRAVYDSIIVVESAPTFDTIYEYHNVSVKPEFIGGVNKLYEFIHTNVNYTIINSEQKNNSKIYAQFVIKKDGSIDYIKIVKGMNKLINDEIIRVIKLMPKWSPGLQNGQAVDVYFTLPVQIHIE